MQAFVTATCLLAYFYTAHCQLFSANRFTTHCARDQPIADQCNGRDVCNDIGLCVCGGLGQGKDCSIPNNFPRDFTNECQCLNGGSCYLQRFIGGTNIRCDCPAAYTGQRCETPRVQLTCTSSNMAVQIYPEYYLRQSVFLSVVDRANSPIRDTFCGPLRSDLDIVSSGEGFSAGRFIKNLPGRASVETRCSDGKITNATHTCYRLQLTYPSQTSMVSWFTAADEIFTLCCSLGGGTVSDGVTASIGAGTGVEVTEYINMATANFFYTGTNQEVLSTVFTGTNISLHIQIAPEARSTIRDFRVTSCYIHGTTAPTTDSITIIQNSCPVTDMPTVFKTITRENDVFGLPVVKVNLFAFRMYYTNYWTMTCTVDTCNGPCLLTNCGNTGTLNIGRKRRQAEATDKANDKLIKEVRASVQVTIEDDRMQLQPPCPAQKSCDLHDAFLPVAIVFAVLLLIAVVAGAVFCVKINRRQRHPRVDVTQAYYKKSTDKA